MEETFERAWRVISVLPEHELTMMPASSIAAHYRGNLPPDAGSPTRPSPITSPRPRSKSMAGPGLFRARGAAVAPARTNCDGHTRDGPASPRSSNCSHASNGSRTTPRGDQARVGVGLRGRRTLGDPGPIPRARTRRGLPGPGPRGRPRSRSRGATPWACFIPTRLASTPRGSPQSAGLAQRRDRAVERRPPSSARGRRSSRGRRASASRDRDRTGLRPTAPSAKSQRHRLPPSLQSELHALELGLDEVEREERLVTRWAAGHQGRGETDHDLSDAGDLVDDSRERLAAASTAARLSVDLHAQARC